ncbi:hypothetical protein CR513_19986, partial [Mucuna pruriens]
MNRTLLIYSVVHFAICGTSLNPSSVAIDINIDATELDQINNYEGTLNFRNHITAAWTWESWEGVNINSGFGVEGSKNLRFCAEESRMVMNEGLLGVKAEFANEIDKKRIKSGKSEIGDTMILVLCSQASDSLFCAKKGVSDALFIIELLCHNAVTVQGCLS